MKLTEAYAYMRYSSHNQDDGWSIEAQKSAIQRYANANNIKVVKFFKDEACTGRNRNRNGYQSMISALENGDVSAILTNTRRITSAFQAAVRRSCQRKISSRYRK